MAVQKKEKLYTADLKKDSAVIAVTIVEDDVELQTLWREYLDTQRGVLCTSSYTTCEEALLHIKSDRPDVILMDINLGRGMSGIAGVRAITKILPDVKILVVTINDDDDSLFESLKAGAHGYFVKSFSLEELLHAIHEIKNTGAAMSPGIGGRVMRYLKREDALDDLTERERQVLRQVCAGYSHKRIASDLDISVDTVKFHIKNIYKKLNVANAAQAGHVAGKNGLV